MTNSPDPGVPQTPAKALTAGLTAAAVGFLMFYVGDEDPFTKKDLAEGLVYSLIGSGLVGGPTYLTRNKRT